MTALYFINNGKKFVSTVKRDSQCIGYVHGTKPYVMGFANRGLAMYTREVIQDSPNITVMRRYYDDVTKTINEGLKYLDIDKQIADVTLDMDAHVTLLKKDDGCEDISEKYDIEDVAFDDFLLYPFNKCLGVALVTRIIDDDNKKVVFTAQVIDPCDDVDLFRNRIKL